MRKIAIVLFFVFCFFSRSNAQWQQMNGPYGETIASGIYKWNDTYIASSMECGIYVSKDISKGWKYVAAGSFYNGLAAVIGDTLVYLGENSSYWNYIILTDSLFTVHNSYYRSENPFDLVSNVGKLYRGDEYDGFFRSTDKGISWEQKNSGLPVKVFTLPHGGGTVYWTFVHSVSSIDHYVFAGTEQGIYRCDSSDMKWQKISDTILGLPQIDHIKSYGNEVYAVADKVAYISKDTGSTWSIFLKAPAKINYIEKIDSIVYLSIYSKGIVTYSSSNGKWDTLNNGLLDKNINLITKLDTVVFCGSNDRGFYYLENSKWVQTIDGMSCTIGAISPFIVRDNFCLANTDVGLSISQDKQNWLDITPSQALPAYSATSWCYSDTIMYMYSKKDSNGNLDTFLLYSKDYGKTWKDGSTFPISWPSDKNSHLLNISGRIFASWKMLSYSDDMGKNWTNVPTINGKCSPFLTSNGFSYFMVGCSALYSFDNNFNYKMEFDLSDSRVSGGYFNLCGNVLFATNNLAHLYCSRDSGKTWTDANGGIEKTYEIWGFVGSNARYYISTNMGVFATKDYGQHWQSMGDGLRNLDVFQMQLLNDTLYLVTDFGVWKRPLNSIYLGVDDEGSYQQTISIYPNPAQSSFMIRSATELHSESINLYNLQGQLVKSFSNMSGKEFIIYRNNLPSGLYTLRILDREGRIYVAKIVLK